MSFSNVRTLVPKKYWDKLRKQTYKRANNNCEICDNNGKTQGFKHNVECHEIWEYNEETLTQILKDLIALCPMCHKVKHFGRSSAIGQQPQTLRHMEIVNQWTHKQCLDHLANAMMTYLRHSKLKWKINLDVLHTQYEVPKKLITEK